MEKRKSIVILAAGAFPTHPTPLRVLHEADAVVCCDSAYCQLAEAHIAVRELTVIGDGDSLPQALKTQLGERWIHESEQDYNDLHKAMHYAAKRYGTDNTDFTLLGATGLREDHTLGNISYLATFADEMPNAHIQMLTDHGRFLYLVGKHTLPSFEGQQVSIFTLTPHIPITLEGLRWPAAGLTLRRWWQATLNHALGSSFSVDGGELIIFQTYDPK